MPITHSVPSTTRKPGVYGEFDLVSGSQGIVPIDQKVLLVGAYAGEMVEIFAEQQAEALFGVGSEMTLMIKAAFSQTRFIGTAPRIYAIAVPEPAGGTQAEKTITVTGPATNSGTILFQVAGVTLSAGVAVGDTDATVALAIKESLDAKVGQLPYTCTVAANVVTLTAITKGENGNAISGRTLDVGLTGVTVAFADSAPGAGLASITTALETSLAEDFELVALANHGLADIATLQAHMAAAWAPGEKKWRYAILAENGTVSTANTLSSTANAKEICVISCEGMQETPGEIAARVACVSATTRIPNENVDAKVILSPPPVPTLAFTNSEIESALAAGTSPLLPTATKTALEIVKLVVTRTMESGGPVEALDLATMRGLTYTARQIDAAFKKNFTGKNKSEQVFKSMRSVCYGILLELEGLGIVQNVDAFMDLLVIESDPSVATRAVVSLPVSVIQNLHQSVIKYVLYVE